MFCFQQVANMMVRMKREFTGSQNSVFPVFDNLLLLDRNVDLLTPLASQLTYEGLIDEIYGIQNSEWLPRAISLVAVRIKHRLCGGRGFTSRVLFECPGVLFFFSSPQPSALVF